MFTMTRALEDTLLQQFIYQKLEIAYAIYKPFPFLEGLRDNFFITETMYRESMEACRNQVPVPRVVYNILTHLEKNFSLSFLEMLFSRINLHEYPHLMTILKGFRSGWSRAVPTLLEAPANPAEGCSLQMLLPLPPPQSHPPHAPSITEPGTSTQHSAEIVGEPSSPSDPAVTLPRATQEESITPGKRKTLSNTSREPPGWQTRSLLPSPQFPRDFSFRLFQALNQILFPLLVMNDDSPEPNDPEELQKASSTPAKKKGKKRKRSIWSTPKKRHQKKRLPKGKMREQEEKLHVVDQAPDRRDDSTRSSKIMTRAQTARIECVQTSESKGKLGTESAIQMFSGRGSCWTESSFTITRAALPGHSTREKLHVVDQAPDRRDDSTRSSKIMTRAQTARIECVQTSESKEKKGEKDVGSSSRRRCQKNIPRKQKPKDETMDFLSPELPVTCGEAKGILYKEKLKQGSSEKCIRNEEGVWFTPKEFEMEGKRTKTRKWKQTVLCRGKPLEELLKKGLLLCPPRISVKREVKSR
uniref:SP110 nuclear body protein n=1 Tax=Ursus americanus TaxID=9643 RepID=A0A452RVF2_URSAM